MATTTAAIAEAAPMLTRRIPRLGEKQVFMPGFKITLIRTPNLPPTYASFIVPLYLTKLDLRDYLINVYGVNVYSVRSYVQQQKVQQDRPNAPLPRPRRWHRPKSIKRMTVEMDSPFIWPAEPEDFAPWDRKQMDDVEKVEEEESEKTKWDGKRPIPERESIAEQARKILSGEQPWK